MIDQAPTVPILHVLTYRPEFEPSWPIRSHLTPITLNYLERPQVEALITRLVQGKVLPKDVVEHIVGKTDGVPLYVEEMTKMLLVSGFLREEADRYTLTWTAVLGQLHRDWPAVQQQAEEVISLATEQGFPFLAAAGTFAQARVRVEQGQRQAGIDQMVRCLSGSRAAGMDQGLPFSLGLLAGAYAQNGQVEEGLTVLAETFTVAHRAAGRYWEAELHRLQGELLLQQHPLDMVQAERCLSQALDTSRRQQAKSWELRSAMSLSRLWQRQEKQEDAHRLLADVYGWFTEGFDTADLQEAQALLDILSRG